MRPALAMPLAGNDDRAAVDAIDRHRLLAALRVTCRLGSGTDWACRCQTRLASSSNRSGVAVVDLSTTFAAIGLSRKICQRARPHSSQCRANQYSNSWLRPTAKAGISTLPPSRHAASRMPPSSRMVSARSRCSCGRRRSIPSAPGRRDRWLAGSRRIGVPFGPRSPENTSLRCRRRHSSTMDEPRMWPASRKAISTPGRIVAALVVGQRLHPSIAACDVLARVQRQRFRLAIAATAVGALGLAFGDRCRIEQHHRHQLRGGRLGVDRPAKPRLTSNGTRPMWSMCAWLMSSASSVRRLERKGLAVARVRLRGCPGSCRSPAAGAGPRPRLRAASR